MTIVIHCDRCEVQTGGNPCEVKPTSRFNDREVVHLCSDCERKLEHWIDGRGVLKRA